MMGAADPTSRALAIVGAGGHGRETLAAARRVNQDGRWSSIEVFDDRIDGLAPCDVERLERVGIVITGSVDRLRGASLPHVIAIGDPAIRRRIAADLEGLPLARVFDPSAMIGDDVELGGGTLVSPGVICTTNVRVGRHSHLNCGVIVSHDCRVGDFVSLSPGVMLNGDVTVENDVFLGTGAIVLPGRRIGQGAVVGAGAVVTEDVEPGRTVVGVPAR